MKFAAALPYIGARDCAKLAHLAEQAGWDGVFLGDAVWCEDPLTGLSAAAMLTERIRLGTLVLPASFRTPWQLAGQAVALDRLSAGRLTLGIGAGATWMGWQGFPTLDADARSRAAALDDTLRILRILFARKQEDYAGSRYSIQLSRLDPQHYPPAPAQPNGPPLWVPALVGSPRNLQHCLLADGALLEKVADNGKAQTPAPADAATLRAWLNSNHPAGAAADLVVTHPAAQIPPTEWHAAGATWLVEPLWDKTVLEAAAILRAGPPSV